MGSSDDLVFIDSGPSMQLISSSSVESLQGIKPEILNDFPSSPPPAAGPSLGCNPCRLAFQPKPEYAPYPPVPESSLNLHHCCHGSCRRKDGLENMDFPQLPIRSGSTSWVTTGINGKLSNTSGSLPPSSYSVSCEPVLQIED